MFILVPNYDYESQSSECRKRICKNDYEEICNLIRFKEDVCRKLKTNTGKTH